MSRHQSPTRDRDRRHRSTERRRLSPDRSKKDPDCPRTDALVDVVMEGLGASLRFQAPATRRFRKMFKVWSERVGVTMDAQAFEYNGQAVSIDDTPELLQVQPGETAIIRATALH